MKVFDYIFYRIAKFYYKRDGVSAFRAVAIISIIQGMLLIDLLIIFLKIFIPVSATAEYVKFGRVIGGVLAILIMILNYRHYKSTYWKLSDRWREKETPLQYKMRGWLVILAIFSPFILLILLGTTFGR